MMTFPATLARSLACALAERETSDATSGERRCRASRNDGRLGVRGLPLSGMARMPVGVARERSQRRCDKGL
jgi:hypothetical protein